jgi:hypothetical protein
VIKQSDGTIIDHKLTRLCLEVIYSTADLHGVDFSDLDLEGKKDFLNRFGKEIIDLCVAQPGGSAFADRVVLWVENSEKETAGLMFVKRKTNAR